MTRVRAIVSGTSHGSVRHQPFKYKIVRPMFKKETLYAVSLVSYFPVSDLPFGGKLLRKLKQGNSGNILRPQIFLDPFRLVSELVTYRDHIFTDNLITDKDQW